MLLFKDHTLGTTSGDYAYVDFNYLADLEKNALFTSPVLRDSSTVCQMNFWYNIRGKKIGAIEVFTNVGSQKSRILKLDQETSNQWKLAKSYIGRFRNAFYITIEGYKNYNEFGYLAIDDIDFKSNIN